jgi:hypothetical protein
VLTKSELKKMLKEKRNRERQEKKEARKQKKLDKAVKKKGGGDFDGASDAQELTISDSEESMTLRKRPHRGRPGEQPGDSAETDTPTRDTVEPVRGRPTMSKTYERFKLGPDYRGPYYGDAHWSETDLDELSDRYGTDRERSPARDRSTDGLTGRAQLTDEDVGPPYPQQGLSSNSAHRIRQSVGRRTVSSWPFLFGSTFCR